jgi:hypothetical protein
MLLHQMTEHGDGAAANYADVEQAVLIRAVLYRNPPLRDGTAVGPRTRSCLGRVTTRPVTGRGRRARLRVRGAPPRRLSRRFWGWATIPSCDR